MSNYQQADLIELHDANNVICKNNMGGMGLREYPEEGYTFEIEGEQLSKICEHLGIKTHKAEREWWDNDGKKKVALDDLRYENFELIRTIRGVMPIQESGRSKRDGTHTPDWIEELEVEVIGPRLINIRTKWMGEDQKINYIQKITYSGAYTIWWSEVPE